jgi:hypothetical protein
MARVLWEFLRFEMREPGAYHYFAEVLNPIGYHGADYGKLAYWELLEVDPDRAGWWRITDLGQDFARNRATVPSHATVYDGRVIRRDGADIRIADIRTKGFDYAELMAERPITDEPK